MVKVKKQHTHPRNTETRSEVPLTRGSKMNVSARAERMSRRQQFLDKDSPDNDACDSRGNERGVKGEHDSSEELSRDSSINTDNEAKHMKKSSNRKDEGRCASVKNIERIERGKARSKTWRKNQTEEQKQRTRELTLIRQRRYLEKCRDKVNERRRENYKKPRTSKQQKKLAKEWRESKRKYRQGMSRQKNVQMNARRRELYIQKKEMRNASKTDATPCRQMTSTPDQSYQSRQALFKAMESVKHTLPKEADKYVQCIKGLMTNTTPRKRRALINSGLLETPRHKKRKEAALNLFNSVNNQLKDPTQRKKGQHLKRRRILCGLASRSGMSYKNVGVNWSFYARCSKLEEECSNFDDYREKRSDAFSVEFVEKVQSFYATNDNSTHMASKADVNKKTKESKKALNCSLRALYNNFVEENLEEDISFSMFCKLRPVNIKTMSTNLFKKCLCEFCTNVELKLKSLNSILKSSGHAELIISNKYELSEMSLCPDKQDPSGWYDPTCIERECASCGVEKVTNSLGNLELDHTYCQWDKWETVSFKHQGKECKRKKLVSHERTYEDLLLELSQDLKPFSLHLHVARWQYKIFDSSIKDIAENQLILCIDFAENYTCQYQNEISGAHWSQTQVTLFPAISYYNCENCDEVVREAVVVISDDLKHDAAATFSCLDAVNTHLNKDSKFDTETVFSDGAPSHFKNTTAFYKVSETHRTQGLKVQWNFFGSRHGKSPCDGEGGVIKMCVSQAVKNGNEVIQSAEDFYRYCDKELSKTGQNDTCIHSKRKFILLNEIARPMKQNLKTVQGIRKLFCVENMRKIGTVRVRNLSCRCANCNQNVLPCTNIPWVEPWEEKVIFRGDGKIAIETDESSDDEVDITINAEDGDKLNVGTEHDNILTVDENEHENILTVDENEHGNLFTVDENEHGNLFTVDENEHGNLFTVDENEHGNLFTVDENEHGNLFTVDENEDANIMNDESEELSNANNAEILTGESKGKIIEEDYEDFKKRFTKGKLPKVNLKGKSIKKTFKINSKVKRQLKKVVTNSVVNSPPSYTRYDFIEPILHSLSLQLDYIREDGNCLFRSVSKCLSGSEVHYKDYRTIVTMFMEDYADFFQQYVDEPIRTHLEKMKKNRVWATHAEIFAAATIFQRKIFVLSPKVIQEIPEDYTWQLFRPVAAIVQRLAFDQGCRCHITIVNTGGVHYDRASTPTGSCNCGVQCPPLDNFEVQLEISDSEMSGDECGQTGVNESPVTVENPIGEDGATMASQIKVETAMPMTEDDLPQSKIDQLAKEIEENVDGTDEPVESAGKEQEPIVAGKQTSPDNSKGEGSILENVNDDHDERIDHSGELSKDNLKHENDDMSEVNLTNVNDDLIDDNLKHVNDDLIDDKIKQGNDDLIDDNLKHVNDNLIDDKIKNDNDDLIGDKIKQGNDDLIDDDNLKHVNDDKSDDYLKHVNDDLSDDNLKNVNDDLINDKIKQGNDDLIDDDNLKHVNDDKSDDYLKHVNDDLSDDNLKNMNDDLINDKIKQGNDDRSDDRTAYTSEYLRFLTNKCNDKIEHVNDDMNDDKSKQVNDDRSDDNIVQGNDDLSEDNLSTVNDDLIDDKIKQGNDDLSDDRTTYTSEYLRFLTNDKIEQVNDDMSDDYLKNVNDDWRHDKIEQGNDDLSKDNLTNVNYDRSDDRTTYTSEYLTNTEESEKDLYIYKIYKIQSQEHEVNDNEIENPENVNDVRDDLINDCDNLSYDNSEQVNDDPGDDNYKQLNDDPSDDNSEQINDQCDDNSKQVNDDLSDYNFEQVHDRSDDISEQVNDDLGEDSEQVIDQSDDYSEQVNDLSIDNYRSDDNYRQGNDRSDDNSEEVNYLSDDNSEQVNDHSDDNSKQVNDDLSDDNFEQVNDRRDDISEQVNDDQCDDNTRQVNDQSDDISEQVNEELADNSEQVIDRSDDISEQVNDDQCDDNPRQVNDQSDDISEQVNDDQCDDNPKQVIDRSDDISEQVNDDQCDDNPRQVNDQSDDISEQVNDELADNSEQVIDRSDDISEQVNDDQCDDNTRQVNDQSDDISEQVNEELADNSEQVIDRSDDISEQVNDDQCDDNPRQVNDQTDDISEQVNDDQCDDNPKQVIDRSDDISEQVNDDQCDDNPRQVNDQSDDISDQVNDELADNSEQVIDRSDDISEQVNDDQYDDNPRQVNDQSDDISEQVNDELADNSEQVIDRSDDISEQVNDDQCDDNPRQVNDQSDDISDQVNDELADNSEQVIDRSDDISEQVNDDQYDDNPRQVNDQSDDISEQVNDELADNSEQVIDRSDDISEQVNDDQCDDNPRQVNDQSDDISEQVNDDLADNSEQVIDRNDDLRDGMRDGQEDLSPYHSKNVNNNPENVIDRSNEIDNPLQPQKGDYLLINVPTVKGSVIPYPAEVLEYIHGEKMLRVNFLQYVNGKKGVFVWPASPDIKWTPISLVVKQLSFPETVISLRKCTLTFKEIAQD